MLPQQYINEFHNDNSIKLDTTELIEIASPGSLVGHSLIFYNGVTSKSYRFLSLTDKIPTSTVNNTSYTTIEASPLFNGIGGFALVAPNGTTLKLLSHGGAFTVDGRVSTDIGVSEPVNTPTGNSLQSMSK
jgi:uncharacterized protein